MAVIGSAAVLLTLVAGTVPTAHAQTSTTTTTTVITDPAITVACGPAQRRTFAPQCNDIALTFEERLSFVLTRTGPTTAPFLVTYRLSGTAQPGVHFDPFPGTTTFPAGSSTVTVAIVPRPVPRGEVVELTLTVTGLPWRRPSRRRRPSSSSAHPRRARSSAATSSRRTPGTRRRRSTWAKRPARSRSGS